MVHSSIFNTGLYNLLFIPSITEMLRCYERIFVLRCALVQKCCRLVNWGWGSCGYFPVEGGCVYGLAVLLTVLSQV